MKVLRKTLLILLVLVFGMVTPAFATEENSKSKKINLDNINFLESIPNIFENFGKNTQSALDKLTEDINKRKNNKNNENSENEEITNNEDNNEEETSSNSGTINLLDKIKAKSESLKGGSLLSLIRERLSSIKLDIKLFDRLKNNANSEEVEENEEQTAGETSENQNLAKGTDDFINSFKNRDNINLFDGKLLERVDSFFNSFIDAIR